MKLEFLEAYKWREEVQKLPLYHQIAFLASISERVISLYNAFAEKSEWENADFELIRECLGEAWLSVHRKKLNKPRLSQLLSNYNDVLPDVSSIESLYVFEARHAAITIFCLSEFCLTSNERLIGGVGMYTHEIIYRKRGQSPSFLKMGM